MREKCYICEKGILEAKNVDFSLFEVNLGKFYAKVCRIYEFTKRQTSTSASRKQNKTSC